MTTQLHTTRLARQFRPMRLGELLDRSIELYRSNFVLLGSLGAAALLPLFALLLAWFYFIFYNRDIWGSPEYTVMAAPFLLGIVLGLCFSFLSRGATIYALSKRAANEEVRLAEAFAHALRRGMTLLLVGLLGLFLVPLAGIFYVIPGIALAISLALAFPVATLEERPYFYVLPRSYQLLKGSTGKLIGLFFTFRLLEFLGLINLLLLRAMLIYLSHSLLNVDLSWLGRLPYGTLILFLLVLVVLHPLKSCAYTLVYFDSRIRNEGWDLWLRIDELTQDQPQGKTP